jgi:hypothetical protein
VLRAIVGVLAAVAVALLLAGAVLVVGMRSGSPRVLDAVRRFNRAVTNRVVVRSAGRAGNETGLIRHVGRTSGRA